MPIIYNPTDANFLTVAQSRTNDGQRDVRVILDITTNIFYTLDDDGVLQEIQSSGGGEDLAQTLTNGNFTDGLDISLTNGSKITSNDNITIEATQGVNKIEINDNSTNMTTDNLLLTFPTGNDNYVINKFVSGGLNTFTTDTEIPVTIADFYPTMPITKVKVKAYGYEDATYYGIYEEFTWAFKVDVDGNYQPIGTQDSIKFSDFNTAGVSIGYGMQNIQILIAGDTGRTIRWVVETEYGDY